MSEATTPEWLREKKAALERGLLKDIREFEHVTGLSVTDVRLLSLDHTRKNDATRRVMTECVEVEAKI